MSAEAGAVLCVWLVLILRQWQRAFGLLCFKAGSGERIARHKERVFRRGVGS